MKQIAALCLAGLLAAVGCHPMLLQPGDDLDPTERQSAGQVLPEPNTEPVTEDEVTLDDPRAAASRLAAEINRESKQPLVRPTTERVKRR